MNRYFIELAYDGTDFHGWQYQPNAMSVQELIESKIQLITNLELSITGCGRTDTGVHATKFFAHFEVEEPMDIEKFSYKLNQVLPVSIVIFRVFKVASETHARYSAKQREYKYYIHQKKNPFKDKFSYYYRFALDVDKMQEAADELLCHKDFSSFARLHGGTNHNLCHLTFARVEKEGDAIVITLKANRFLRNMVRAIVGTLLDVGTGKTSLEGFKDIIHSKNRSVAGSSAPAKGLFLTDVVYDFD